MKKILFTLSVSCFSIAYTQNLNFIDSKFKALILSSNSSNEIAKDLNGNSIAIDANGDGEIQVSEAQQVVVLNIKQDENHKYLDPAGNPYDQSNINLPYYFTHLPDGISDALLFTNVEELYISDTENADISFVNNTKIKNLICENRWFYDEGSFNGNYYESDFYPVDFTIDNCPSILTMNNISASYHPYSLGHAIFRIKNNPQFNGALVLDNRLVQELYFENVNFTSININDCRGLEKLSVPNIATLQTINITNTQNSQNSDQEINLIANNCNALQEIVLDGDYYDSRAVYLSAINVNGCTSLKKIKGLNAPNINFSTAGLVNLEELNCAFHNRYSYTSSSLGSVLLGKVNSIDLTGLPNLKKLLAYNQPLNNINLVGSPLIEEINMVNAASFLTTFDVSNLANLHTLNAFKVPNTIDVPANLLQINAQNCTSLVNLNIKENYFLQSLNLKNCSSLESLSINLYTQYFPELTNLNLEQCSSLKELNLSSTKVNNLDISACILLESLTLRDNQFISQLDTSSNTNLETADIGQCPQINELDFSNNSGLESISLSNMANLTSLNIKNGSIEQSVAFGNNYNPSLSVCVDDAQLAGLQAQYPSINFSTNCNSLFTTTWNGTSWSNGAPNLKNVVITGTYTTSTTSPAFNAKNMTIQNGGTLEITSGNTISALNVTVEDGANLIQKDGSTLSYSGAFKALKSGTSEVNKYAFWSSPIMGQNLANIYTGATPAFITEYDTATDYYVNANSTTSVFGKGYSIKTPIANAALVFQGAPNNGTQTFTLATSGNGFNLIGNPYPSSLDLGVFYSTNSARISSTFYFWDNKSTNVNLQNGATTTNYGYATFNGANPTWVPAPNSNGGTSVVPTGAVANIGQAFIVKTLNSSVDTSLTFNNEMRGATNGTFFNKNNSTEGKFWLKLNSEYNTNNIFAVNYTTGASDSFDTYDSKAIGMGSDAFYTLADAQKLIIQGKESFDINDVVPVGVRHFQNGNFTISLVQKEGLFNNGQAIYLHDKVTGTYTNLQNGAYTFTANAGESTDRFEIVYKLDVLATTEVNKDSFEIYRDGEDFVVRNNKNIEKVEIFDAAGRKIQTINENSKLIRVQVPSKGIYILKATSEGKEYTKKIIK